MEIKVNKNISTLMEGLAYEIQIRGDLMKIEDADWLVDEHRAFTIAYMTALDTLVELYVGPEDMERLGKIIFRCFNYKSDTLIVRGEHGI